MLRPFFPSTQEPSHCFSWGQTLPHTAGRLLLRPMISLASPMFPWEIALINSGISLEMGQPSLHFGTLQPRQRPASRMAYWTESPLCSSLYFGILSFTD